VCARNAGNTIRRRRSRLPAPDRRLNRHGGATPS
jgi:hypothetical protein